MVPAAYANMAYAVFFKKNFFHSQKFSITQSGKMPDTLIFLQDSGVFSAIKMETRDNDRSVKGKAPICTLHKRKK